MNPWTFMDYCTDDGHNLIQEWYDQQDVALQAAFDQTLLILRAVDDWTDPGMREFKKLTKRHQGLAEIRFKIPVINPETRKPFERRFRPAGIWRPEKRDFILLLGCEKVGRTNIPHDAFGLALNYKAQFEEGKGRIYEHV